VYSNVVNVKHNLRYQYITVYRLRGYAYSAI